MIGFFTGSTERKEIKNLQMGVFEKSKQQSNMKNLDFQSHAGEIQKENHTVITQKLGADFYEADTTFIQSENKFFMIEKEIILVHTKEII